MTRYPWAILHHDGIRQYVRVPADNGGEYMDMVCEELVLKDVGEDVSFRAKDFEFVCERKHVRTHLTVSST